MAKKSDEASEAPAKRGGFVRYTRYGERTLSDEDLKGLGSKSKGATWGKRNARRVPASQFDEVAINYLLNVDGGFVLEQGT